MMDASKGGRRSRNKVVSILVTTSHPSTGAIASTNAASANSTNVGGAVTLLCPRTGAIQCSTRIHGGDHHHISSSGNSSSSVAALMSSSGYSTKGQVGVSHLSFFPNIRHRIGNDASSSSTSSPLFAMAYGASTEKSADSYGMLISLRRNHASVPPYVHWKCRLPESNMSGGLLVSPVTLQHVIGGGHSGTLYVWNTFQNGNLIRVFPSVHYRAITCMTWSTNSNHNMVSSTTLNPWNAVLVTAGADGMVHCFSHVDLVESMTTASGNNKIHPIRSWTKHNLPVTSLISIHQGSRIVSSGEDGYIVIMELCSGSTIATIQLPHAIRTMQVNSTTADHVNIRLYAGSNQGMIYIIDLDTYACYSTVQMGATMIQTPPPPPPPPTTTQWHQHSTLSIEDQVFGIDHSISDVAAATAATNAASSNSSSYQSELRGHNFAITSLAVFHTDDDDESTHSGRSTTTTTTNECLISGDEMGIVRIWDTRRGCCLRVLYPWSCAAPSGGATSKSSNIHPVTSIHIIYDDESNPILFGNENTGMTTTAAMFGNTTGTDVDQKRKRMLNFANLIAPLQKFTNDTEDNDPTAASAATTILVPFLQPSSNISSMDTYWNVHTGHEMIRHALQRSNDRKRPRPNNGKTKAMAQDSDDKTLEAEVTSGVVMSDVANTNTGTNTTAAAVATDDDAHASLVSEVERLQQELNTAQATIARWELVNNKLMERINNKR